jgi:hypothetical protein
VTILLALLRRYWLHIAIAAALVAAQGYALRWAWVHGGDSVRLSCAEKREKLIEAALKDMQDLEAQRNAAQRKADELAKLPPKVIERVRQNPANCDIPKPVADELRKQVDEINRAIRERGVR